jgi:hypothetical protein|tara:strand:+ start:341 stop:640 length:300 start_codon:yes stop_codon:yes gene_type:complete
MILITKFLFWLKNKYKILFSLFISLAIIFYIHSEFVSWAKATQNTEYLGFSYILKNIIIILLFCTYFLFIFKKSDGFDKFRNKEKLTSKADRIINKNND